ncbi:hypothetical protein J6590_036628 [Homalodisca vitripennis]|nr:hypothetical protein J6590_036628 [Homalodisca vitripennis]
MDTRKEKTTESRWTETTISLVGRIFESIKDIIVRYVVLEGHQEGEDNREDTEKESRWTETTISLVGRIFRVLKILLFVTLFWRDTRKEKKQRVDDKHKQKEKKQRVITTGRRRQQRVDGRKRLLVLSAVSSRALKILLFVTLFWKDTRKEKTTESRWTETNISLVGRIFESIKDIIVRYVVLDGHQEGEDNRE